VDGNEIVKTLDDGTQPILYCNVYNARCRVIGYEKHDPDGAAVFTCEVEGHGTFSGISEIELFEDREPEYAADERGPQTDWAWTSPATVEALVEEGKP
jgi:hypothetical protein